MEAARIAILAKAAKAIIKRMDAQLDEEKAKRRSSSSSTDLTTDDSQDPRSKRRSLSETDKSE
jgi:hypothetical protein